MRELRRGVWLYRRHLGARVRSLAAYRADFWIMIVASAATQAVGLVFLWAVFLKIPSLHGWTFWQIVLVYATVYVAEGVCSVLFNGTWGISAMVNRGELDRLLVRPFSVVGQIMSGSIGVNGFGNVVLGGAMIVVALTRLDLDWSVGKALVGVVLLLGAIGVKLGLNLATNATAFWIGGPFSVFAMSIHQAGELARFPLSIYAPAIRLVLTVGLPFAFMSYFPVTAFLGTGETPLVGLLTPLVAAWTIALGVLVVRRGLRRYESAGN